MLIRTRTSYVPSLHFHRCLLSCHHISCTWLECEARTFIYSDTVYLTVQELRSGSTNLRFTSVYLRRLEAIDPLLLGRIAWLLGGKEYLQFSGLLPSSALEY